MGLQIDNRLTGRALFAEDTLELCMEEYEDMGMLFGRGSDGGSCSSPKESSAENDDSHVGCKMALLGIELGLFGWKVSKSPIRPNASRVKRCVIPRADRMGESRLRIAFSQRLLYFSERIEIASSYCNGNITFWELEPRE